MLGTSTRARRATKRLDATGILAGCPPEELDRIAEVSRVVSVPAGRILCEQGRLALDCMLIEAGRSDVLVGTRRVASPGPGETIGEIGVLDRRPRSATVVARTDMRVRIIEATDFDALLRDAPVFSRAVLRELSGRVRSANHTP